MTCVCRTTRILDYYVTAKKLRSPGCQILSSMQPASHVDRLIDQTRRPIGPQVMLAELATVQGQHPPRLRLKSIYPALHATSLSDEPPTPSFSHPFSLIFPASRVYYAYFTSYYEKARERFRSSSKRTLTRRRCGVWLPKDHGTWV